MARVAPSQAVVEIVRVTRERMPQILEEMQKRIRAEIPFYAAEDVVAAGELRDSLQANVDYILDGLAGTGAADLRAPEVTGRARAAKGAPLVEMLAAYRLGFAQVWTELVAAARSVRGIPDAVLVDLAGAMFALQNEYSDASVTGYRDEHQQIVRATERERSALVEAVLAGTAAQGPLWEVAQALRLPLEGAFVVVAAETIEVGHDPLPRIESALSPLDVRSVWRLQPDLAVGVLSLRKRSRAGDALGVLGRQATGRVGVSPVFEELARASRALRLARLAVAHQPAGPGVEQFRDSPLTLLVASAPAAALEAAHTVLGTVLALPDDDRDLLLTTFTAWLDAGGSAAGTAAVLFCHPNTVRYRLRRIEDATGRTLAHPADVAELVTAVRAWSELPHGGAAAP
ncbi:PucR family transcriptional regulator [Pseudonocardia sp. GCM10023141]|uniref:PucR family transcriptional regulator n=1 Tax=Pseudonocardia sp. GCM10023141 TaxID=3252653 RepID=UPI0036108B48